MTIKPTKKWVVGDRVFEDYSAACAHARELRDGSGRAALIDFLEQNCLVGGLAEEIADKLLARYTLKVWKPRT